MAQITTLGAEVAVYRDILENRVQSYVGAKTLPTGNTVAERVLAVLLGHTEYRVKISVWERERLLARIEEMVVRGEPIRMAMLFALSCRAPNPMKFRERVNLPHLGWMHFYATFAFIHEKVKRVYAPGIQLVVFDEGEIIGRHIAVDEASIPNCFTAAQHIARIMGVPIDIRPMPMEDFPADKVATMTNGGVTDGRIFSLLCSLPDMVDPEIMDGLYVDRKGRDFDKIRKRAGAMWDRAHAMAVALDQLMLWRKHARLFHHWLENDRFLDVTITDKDNRIVFDVTQTMVNHGMPVVERSVAGKHRVRIVPEYRMNGEVPVRIKASEVLPGGSADEFTFYYLVQNGAH